MQIRELLSGMHLAVTNEEHQFISKHPNTVRVTSLDDRGQWLAQNIVRKGVYSISKDNCTLVNKLNEPHN
jgi:predicted secreted protein